MVFVTGGAGYIGSHMVRRLCEEGEPCVVFDSLETGHRRAVPAGVPLIEGDLRSPAAILDALRSCPQVDSVVHFAASISVGESVREPAKYAANNVGGSENLVAAMERLGIGNLVFSSTAAVYGEPVEAPIPESHPKHPVSPYGETKLAVETALDANPRIRSICLRYFNAAGAHESGEIGEAHDPEEHLIPIAIGAALETRPPMTILGDDYPTPDGTCIRDFVHVQDLVEAHVLAVRHLRAGGPSRRFNVGSGTGHSVRQVLEAVEHVLGVRVPYSVGPRRAGDPARLVASAEAIRSEWGWSHRRTLAEIVASAARWHRSHPLGFGST